MKVINIRNAPDGWRDNPQYVYIGRANKTYSVPKSKWHNPYSVSMVGSRQAAIDGFRQYIEGRPSLLADLYKLRGKTLVCWCAPKACHGDVLAELVQQHTAVNVFDVTTEASSGKPKPPPTRYEWRPATLDEQRRDAVAYRVEHTHIWHADGHWLPYTRELRYTEQMLRRRYSHYLIGCAHGDDVPGWWLAWDRTQAWIENFKYQTRNAA